MKFRNKKLICVSLLIILICIFNFYSSFSGLYAKNSNLIGTSSITKININVIPVPASLDDDTDVVMAVTVAAAFMAAGSVGVAIAASAAAAAGVVPFDIDNLSSNSVLNNIRATDLLLHQLP